MKHDSQSIKNYGIESGDNLPNVLQANKQPVKCADNCMNGPMLTRLDIDNWIASVRLKQNETHLGAIHTGDEFTQLFDRRKRHKECLPKT